jgi:ribosomal protein L16 Arg81 hydroxylase
LCQIKGSRTISLFDPLQADLLYLNPLNPAYSLVDPRNPDYEKFPLFKKAKSLEVTLNPGEILYLPFQWFHFVKSNSGKNLAVNYWYYGDSEVLEHSVKVLSNLFWRDPYDPNELFISKRKEKISQRLTDLRMKKMGNIKNFEK